MKQFLPLLFICLVASSCAQLKRGSARVSGLLDAPKRPQSIFNVAWVKNLDPPHDSGNLPIGSASPLVHEGLVFMGSLDGVMSSYQLETGRLLWSANEAQSINAQAAMFENTVIYGSMEGRVFSRHYLTGELVYAIDLGSPVEAAPVVVGGRMFFHLRDHRIVAMDAATGKIFWIYDRSVPYSTTLQRVSKVLPYNNRLIVGFADGYLASLSMEEGVVAWEQKLSNQVKFIDVDADPVYFEGRIAAGSAAGELRFINPENGLIEQAVDLRIAHSPVKLKNSLVVGTTFGEVAIVDATGNIVKKTKLLEEGISSVALWKEGLAVATMSGALFFLDKSTLEVIETYQLGHEQSAVFGSLQVEDGYLAVYSSRNRLYLFK